jgi:hypothetical protein
MQCSWIFLTCDLQRNTKGVTGQDFRSCLAAAALRWICNGGRRGGWEGLPGSIVHLPIVVRECDAAFLPKVIWIWGNILCFTSTFSHNMGDRNVFVKIYVIVACECDAMWIRCLSFIFLLKLGSPIIFSGSATDYSSKQPLHRAWRRW